jgi:HEAT repeat protein
LIGTTRRTILLEHQLALIPRAVYAEALVASLSGQLAAAIEGVGETGTLRDADLIVPFLNGNRPRIRRSALRALGKLDTECAVSAAIAALADDASSVRSEAVGILATSAAPSLNSASG